MEQRVMPIFFGPESIASYRESLPVAFETANQSPFHACGQARILPSGGPQLGALEWMFETSVPRCDLKKAIRPFLFALHRNIRFVVQS